MVGEGDGCGQNEFLIAAAESLAAKGDGGFAAGEEADAAAAVGDRFARDGGVHAGDVASFAIDGSGED